MTKILPDKLPKWYAASDQGDKGRSLKTKEIELDYVENAWNGYAKTDSFIKPTIILDNLYILSPLQIGGGSLPEGDNLPAQMVGVPCIPGSVIRGSFLSWIVKLCQEYESGKSNSSINKEEYEFWQRYLYLSSTKKPKLTLSDHDSVKVVERYPRWGWKPKAIRFETTWMPGKIKPFPFNPQQDWQIFDEDNGKLGVLWQVDGVRWKAESNHTQLSIVVNLHEPITEKEKQWFEERLEDMLIEQGVGRGSASGFGKLGTGLPDDPKWTIKLEGMKPAINSGKTTYDNYRWSPQVLRACLRGYFTRLALTYLSEEDAKGLTDIVFGGLKSPGRLFLNSYLADRIENANPQSHEYSNINKKIVEETWIIEVDCNNEFKDLIDNLLSLASKLGGLGAGWRRPPHCITKEKPDNKGNPDTIYLYRGSSFTVNAQSLSKKLSELLTYLQNEIKQLAKVNELSINSSSRKGSLISIWQSKEWRNNLVHGICSSRKKDRPIWCGSSGHRPSGYAVSDRETHSLITVFDRQVEKTLGNFGINACVKIWSSC